jgi:hypothetical protein
MAAYEYAAVCRICHQSTVDTRARSPKWRRSRRVRRRVFPPFRNTRGEAEWGCATAGIRDAEGVTSGARTRLRGTGGCRARARLRGAAQPWLRPHLRARAQLVEFLRGAKFPLARRPDKLPKYTHAAQTPRGPRVASRPRASWANARLQRQDPPIPAAAKARAQAADHRVTLLTN